MIPAVNIGPFVLPTAAFAYIVGAWVCISLAEYSARRLNLDPASISGVVTAGIISGVIGARLTFVFTYWSTYQDNLLGIIWPINSGFNPLGGLIFGVAAMVFYGRHRQLQPLSTLDALAPIIIVGLMIVSLADFVGGPGFGTTTNMPWGFTQFNIRRHPVQLYELGIGLVCLIAWWGISKRRSFAGQLFLVTISVYCMGRLLVDAFRANPWTVGGGWHVIQIVSLLLALVCLGLLAQKSHLQPDAQSRQ